MVKEEVVIRHVQYRQDGVCYNVLLSNPWKFCRFLWFFLTNIDVGPNIVSDTFLTNDHAYSCDWQHWFTWLIYYSTFSEKAVIFLLFISYAILNFLCYCIPMNVNTKRRLRFFVKNDTKYASVFLFIHELILACVLCRWGHLLSVKLENRMWKLF